MDVATAGSGALIPWGKTLAVRADAFRGTDLARRPLGESAGRNSLSAESQRFDDGPVALNVVVFNVVEQTSPTADQHEQSAAGVVVLGVDLQMLGEILDAMGQQTDLYLRATGVAVMQLILFNQYFFILGR
jgi:hypothetical protein